MLRRELFGRERGERADEGAESCAQGYTDGLLNANQKWNAKSTEEANDQSGQHHRPARNRIAGFRIAGGDQNAGVAEFLAAVAAPDSLVGPGSQLLFAALGTAPARDGRRERGTRFLRCFGWRGVRGIVQKSLVDGAGVDTTARW